MAEKKKESPPKSPQLLPAFRFEVTLLRSAQVVPEAFGWWYLDLLLAGQSLGDGGFQECSGLEVEMDVQEYQEGGRNDGVIRRVGRAKYSNIVLKRGMFYGEDEQASRQLWEWLQGVVSGKRPVTRYDGIVQVRNAAGTTVATWAFERGLPAKIRGPELNAKTGEVAIEELHIAHEGLRMIRS